MDYFRLMCSSPRGMCSAVLVCVGDTLTRFVGPRDRSTRMLFGDAGSAALVRRGGASHRYSVQTRGAGWPHIHIPAGGARLPLSDATRIEQLHPDGNWRSPEHLLMNGPEVMAFAVRDVAQNIEAFLKASDASLADAQTFVLHQANALILQFVAKRLKLSPERVPFLCSDFGNVAGASIPLALCAGREVLAGSTRQCPSRGIRRRAVVCDPSGGSHGDDLWRCHRDVTLCWQTLIGRTLWIRMHCIGSWPLVFQVPLSRMTPELVLADCNWDSLAQVSAILVLDSHGGTKVSPSALAQCRTLAEIEALLKTGA